MATYRLVLPVPAMIERLLGWFVERRIAAPGEDALGALVVAARRTFEDKVLEAIALSLSPEHRRGLDASLADEEGATSFSDLKSDPGQPNLDNVPLATSHPRAAAYAARPSAPRLHQLSPD